MLHAAHAQIVLCKLYMLELNGWDIEDVQATLDFASVIEQQIAAANRAAADDQHIFQRSARPLQVFKTWCDNRRNAETRNQGWTPQSIDIPNFGDQDINQGLFEDDAFWEGLMMRGWDATS